MKTIAFLLVVCLTTVAARPQQERIVGGTTVAINTYPFAASLQIRSGNVFRHTCGATILNNRSLLSAAHCWYLNRSANTYQMRIGSSNASSGGRIHVIAQLIMHAQFSMRTIDHDIGMIRVTVAIPLGSATIRAGSVPPANVNIPENAVVMALGWGQTYTNSMSSEQLRHVQLRIANQAQCNRDFHGMVTANMICANGGNGRGVCGGDSGTGLLFNNVVIGVTSFYHGTGCGTQFPDVFTRLSRYAAWINNNA